MSWLSKAIGSVGDTLFGTKPKVEKSTESLWTPEQQQLFTETLLPQLTSPVQVGSTPSSASDIYSLSLSGIERMLSGEGAMGALDQSTKSLLDLLQRGPENIDEYFTKTVQDPMLEAFREDVLPAINRQYAPSGFYSSQRLSADQRAREDLIDALTQSRAGFAYEGLQADLDRRLGASAGLNQTQQLISQLLGTGLQTGVGEWQLSSEQIQYQREQQRINQLLQALGLQGQENIVAVNPGSTGLVQSAAQGAASAIPFLLAA